MAESRLTMGRLNFSHFKEQNKYSQWSYGQSPPIYQHPYYNHTSPSLYMPPSQPQPQNNNIAVNPTLPTRIAAEPVVIGFMVLDINATPITRVVDSNQTPNSARLSASPGKIAYAMGGVARNVADCMFKLEAKPFLISAVGNDWAGNLLWERWKSTGLPLQGIMRDPEIETAVRSHIYDGEGELAAAVASVESIETSLAPNWIEKLKTQISSAPILMVDANLSSHSLEASCKMAAEFRVPVWFDPASVAKSTRIASVVNYVSFVSGNEDELIAMANALHGDGDKFPQVRREHSSSVESLFEMLKPAISLLLDKKVKVIVVTIGSDGVFLCAKSKSDLGGLDFKGKQPPNLTKDWCEAANAEWSTHKHLGASSYNLCSDFYAVHFPALSASVVRVTGAGDCLIGGTIASLCAGLDVMQSVSVGIAAARFAVEAETYVPAELSLAKIISDARHVYARMTVSQRNITKNPSATTKPITTKSLPTSQPPTPKLQSQNRIVGFNAPSVSRSTNHGQISQGHMNVSYYQQSNGTITNENTESTAPEEKDDAEKLDFLKAVKSNIPYEAMQDDKHEESQVAEEEKEEEDDLSNWKTVPSKKEKKRSAKEAREANQRNGKNKNKHTKYWNYQ